jgi:colanic acid/amylovoran biosynthesis protein
MKKIILTNQHSDNRGDESAVIGVVSSLRKYFGEDTQIIVYLQSGTGTKFLLESYNIIERSMLVDIYSFGEMLLWVLFKVLGIDIRVVTSKRMKEFLQTHEEADIVVSSCGGPYIGDIYIQHEILHIIHLFVPQVLGKKTAFYAPSMGPFKNKFMNYFRRKLLERTDVIVLRDSISYQYVKEFLPKKTNIHLTTDSCLAYDISLDNMISLKNTIGITPLNYEFPLASDRRVKKIEYESTIVNILDMLMEETPTLSVEFFPQLYGKHTDVPYIKKIIRQLKYPERAIIFSDKKSGVDQQKEIARLNFMIACRYHPAIFACKVRTPVVCIAYEHKSRGFMESVNLGNYCIDIYHLDADGLREKIRMLQGNRDKIQKELPASIGRLQELADSTARLLYENFYND